MVSVATGGVTYTTVCEDISMHGIFLARDNPLPVGSDVRLSFLLPGHESPPIHVRGRVVWINGRQSRLPVGFGVHFLEVTWEGLPLLRSNDLKRFIDAHVPSR